MKRRSIAKYLNPWMLQREKQQQQRLAELRRRDGDNCWRCRRPLRFDLPRGHEQAPTLEPMLSRSKSGALALDNLCLCHGRCNAELGDSTSEVMERMRMRMRADDAERSPAVAARKRKVA